MKLEELRNMFRAKDDGEPLRLKNPIPENFIANEIEWRLVPGTSIPKPKVKLVGENGNSHNIMALVQQALRKAGVPKQVIQAYLKESKSKDYDNLLQTAMRYADVE